MKYNRRYIARFTVEAETPLSVGSGEKGISTDRLVAKDANGLPYIPGTSLAGVLRSSLSDMDFTNDVFGFGGENGTGSRLIVSSAHLVGDDGKTVIEGLKNIDLDSEYYAYFKTLPERDHVRITDKGAAAEHAKFDEELVHKGTRFVFELELVGDKNDKEIWSKLLNALASPVFRIGAGTRKGFGKFKIIKDSTKNKVFDLATPNELQAYLNKSSSLNEPMTGWDEITFNTGENNNNWTCYKLVIQPKNFFLFGAGFGDDDADSKPKTERYFEWRNGKPELIKQDCLLMPGTSVKGAIAHRVAFYYNKEKGETIGHSNKVSLATQINIEEAISIAGKRIDIDSAAFPSGSDQWDALEAQINALQVDGIAEWKEFKDALDEEVLAKEISSLPVGENNEAVKALFGYSKNSEQKIDGLRGRVIVNDIYLPYDVKNDKIFNHVKIDRFTNGTIDGALFQEKATQYKDNIILDIWVDKAAFKQDDLIEKAFLSTLDDITSGSLQLGGNSSKGHGVFTGALK